MAAVCPQCNTPVLATATRCGRCGATFAPARRDPLIGRTVGNLRLVERLGTGGMGSVYRAEHTALGTPYAVKVLHQQFSNDEMVAERFRREAVACSRLRHENTVFVTDFGVDDDVGIYLVMEYLAGSALNAILKAERRLSLTRFHHIASQVCLAMAAAHRLGIVHRDLKPENVMVLPDEGRGERVKVLDFGIAHLRDPGEQGDTSGGTLTHGDSVVGTPAYMSPEQIDRKLGAVGPHSDVYSLGVILFECLTGQRPFLGTSDLAILSHHLTQTPPLVSTLRPELAGTQLEALVANLLSKDLAVRIATMDGVHDALLDAMDDLESSGLVELPFAQPPQRTSIPTPMLTPVTTTSPRADASGAHSALRSNPSIKITAVLEKIRRESPDSPAATLLQALPDADAMRGEALTMAIWGVLQHELLDAPMTEPRFADSLTHLALLFEAVVDTHPEAPATASQEKVFRSLKNLLTLAEADRQRRVVDALAPLMSRPVFPMESLPKSLQPKQSNKTWDAVRGVMTKEINLWPSRKERESAPPSPPRDSAPPRESVPPPEAAAPAAPAAPESPAAPATSLLDKLKQPVTMGALKSVFTHEIKVFGDKKK